MWEISPFVLWYQPDFSCYKKAEVLFGTPALW